MGMRDKFTYTFHFKLTDFFLLETETFKMKPINQKCSFLRQRQNKNLRG